MKKIVLSSIVALTAIQGTLSAKTIKEEIKLETSPEILISKDIYFNHLKEQKSFENDLLELEISKLEKERSKEKLMFEIDRIKRTNAVNDLISKENMIKRAKLDLEYQKLSKQKEFTEKYPLGSLGIDITEDDLTRNLILAKLENQKSSSELARVNNEKLQVYKENIQLLNEVRNYNNKDLNKYSLELKTVLLNDNDSDKVENIIQNINLVLGSLEVKLNKLMFKSENSLFNNKFISIEENYLEISSLINDINIKRSSGTLKNVETKSYFNEINEKVLNVKSILNDIIINNKKIISNFSEQNIIIDIEEENQNEGISTSTISKADYSKFPKIVQEKIKSFDKRIDNLRESINVVGTPQTELLNQLLKVLEIPYQNKNDNELKNILLKELKLSYQNKFKTITNYEIKNEEEKKELQQDKTMASYKTRKIQAETKKQEQLNKLKVQNQKRLSSEVKFIKENLKVESVINNNVSFYNSKLSETFSKKIGQDINGWKIKNWDHNNRLVTLEKEDFNITIGMKSFDLEEYSKRIGEEDKKQDMGPQQISVPIMPTVTPQ